MLFSPNLRQLLKWLACIFVGKSTQNQAKELTGIQSASKAEIIVMNDASGSSNTQTLGYKST
jgi:hypothetical protein